MKTLYLMRHAKSAHGAGLSRDHDRTLNARGREATTLVGDHMAAHGMVPDHILCSDAARTRETLNLLLTRLPPGPTTEVRPDLYLAGARKVMTLVRALPDGTASALVLGHNPGLESLAHTFAAHRFVAQTTTKSDCGGQDPPMGLGREFPTAALAVIQFDIDRWQQARPGQGRLVGFVLPRALAEN